MARLTDEQIQAELSTMAGWNYTNGEIVKTFELPSFPDAIVLVNGVAELAEEHGHHPDMDIRYNRVRFGLVTHDAGGVTAKDIALARAIEELSQFNPDERSSIIA